MALFKRKRSFWHRSKSLVSSQGWLCLVMKKSRVELDQRGFFVGAAGRYYSAPISFNKLLALSTCFICHSM